MDSNYLLLKCLDSGLWVDLRNRTEEQKTEHIKIRLFAHGHFCKALTKMFCRIHVLFKL